MQTISISDVTLQHTAAKADQTLSFREKLEIAKLLDRIQVSVIETAPIENDKVDALLIKTIAGALKSSILSVPVPHSEEGVAQAWEAVKDAVHPRLQVAVPVSPVQMEYRCHKKPPMVLAMVCALVRTCKKFCDDVEFVADDATRAVPEFLHSAIAAALEAGATTVTVADDAGAMTPAEFADFLRTLHEAVPELARCAVGVRCSNELGFAAACAQAALAVGAVEVKVSTMGDELPALETVAQFLRVRGDSCQMRSTLQITELQRAVSQIRRIGSAKKSKTSPFDSGVQPPADGATLFLGSFDDMAAVSRAVKKLGYDLSEDDTAKVFEEFTRIVQKKNVGAKELDAIVASVALQVPPTYHLHSYVINCGNVISATAHLQLEKDGKPVTGVCVGDGPIDAAFLAIEQIVGHHYELDDFQIQAVTEGREAMGSALVKLRAGGKLYSGKGISTDIIGAAIRAYVNALNKIVYGEA